MTWNKDQGEFQMSRIPTEQVVHEDKQTTIKKNPNQPPSYQTSGALR